MKANPDKFQTLAVGKKKNVDKTEVLTYLEIKLTWKKK